MIIYIYAKCSTCQNALKFLKKHKIEVEIKEITKKPPALVELHKMFDYQNENIKKIFNTSGLLYKEMNLKEKLSSLSLEEALKLLHDHGMLIKRPFLLGKNFGLVGFKETEWIEMLKDMQILDKIVSN